MAGARIDMGAAIATAVAMGCAADVAAPLVMAVQHGLAAAEAKRRAGDVR